MGHVPRKRARMPGATPRRALAVSLAYLAGAIGWYVTRVSLASARPAATAFSYLLIAAASVMAARAWRGLVRPGRPGPSSRSGRMGGMAREYTPEQRERIGEQAAGKRVASLEYDDDPAAGYWSMTFTDGTEISFRLMAELA
jgi:hypothetical protein